MTEVFDLRHLIGSTPQATVFQAAFCFLLSNVIQTVRGYVAEAEKCRPETISTQLLFEEPRIEYQANPVEYAREVIEGGQEHWLDGQATTSNVTTNCDIQSVD